MQTKKLEDLQPGDIVIVTVRPNPELPARSRYLILVRKWHKNGYLVGHNTWTDLDELMQKVSKLPGVSGPLIGAIGAPVYFMKDVIDKEVVCLGQWDFGERKVIE